MGRVKACIVDPGGLVTYGEIDRDLSTLQEVVGGYLEGISGDTFFAYCNEEGKLRGLPVNLVATEALGMTTDAVRGTVLFLGPIDDEGEETDVTADTVTRVIAASERFHKGVRA